MEENITEYKKGSLHPLTLIMNETVSIFKDLGFAVEVGPELEDEWHNFDALNVPKDHPARDMQDTFFIRPARPHEGAGGDKKTMVLRTHTSNTQIRYMENLVKTGGKPPFAIVVPGKVFRNESTDATHEMQFHQIEGLMIGEDISVANMKGVLLEFFKRFFDGEKVDIRLRPSFFPFVEPGFEIDLRIGEKWIELLGAGMVHPNVLKNCGIDGEKYQGFAFGIGLDRLMMMKLKIPDVRASYKGDLRINQF
jgi:phenylalanyl-tRNA synthetase alpha chain